MPGAEMKDITARDAALLALAAYRRNGVWPERSLGGIFGKYEMSSRDTALAWRILNGVIQNLMLIDYYIAKFSSMKKIEPQVLDILRISVYQIVFMDIPNSAAVNEGVRMAKKRANPRAAGFVNAILRRISDSEMPQVSADTVAERLAIKYSHPQWLVEEFTVRLGLHDAQLLLEENNADDTPLTVQVNTLSADTDTVLQELIAAGYDAARHEWLENCVVIRDAGNLEKLSVFKRGFIYVQDAAARLAVIAAGVGPGDFIIDACAAPGGKSFAAAIASGDDATVYACDISDGKLVYIIDGAKRLGLNSIETRALDASVYNEKFTGMADVVIADVPCSGFGVIRKKPEIRYKKQEEVEGLPVIQGRILDNLSKYVKPGGVLIYSTCTVLKSENEDVVDCFLNNNGEFVPEGFTLPKIGHVECGNITLWPHIHGTDGFFISRLRRRGK